MTHIHLLLLESHYKKEQNSTEIFFFTDFYYFSLRIEDESKLAVSFGQLNIREKWRPINNYIPTNHIDIIIIKYIFSSKRMKLYNQTTLCTTK